MHIFAVIPVKLKNPKTRLSKFFNESFRKELVLSMLDDVLTACSKVDNIDVVVVSNEKPCLDYDFYFVEDNLSGLTQAVNIGNSFAIKKGGEATIFLPADIPLIKSKDLKDIIKYAEENNVVIAKSSKNGVSAILRKPPNIFDVVFSDKSFVDIMKSLKSKGIKTKVLERFSLWLDIDTIEDVKIFLKYGKGTKTYELLKERL